MKRLAILLFDGVELLDFAGPAEVFSCVDIVSGQELLKVFTVAPEATIHCHNGLSVNVDHELARTPAFDWLLVPGGAGTRELMRRPEAMNWVVRYGETCERVLSVCTGALVLGAAGFLQGHRATTHHEHYDDLRRVSPGCRVREGERFVCDGRFATAAGVTAGIDLALAVVKAEFGEELAAAAARRIEHEGAGWGAGEGDR